MTAQELADETGKTLGSVRRAVRRLESLRVVEAERESARAPKVYSLPQDWSDKVDELRPTLRTYQLGDWREERRLYEALCWQHRRYPDINALQDEDERKAARRRRAKLETERAAVLQRLYPTLDAAEVWRMAIDVNVKRWTQARAERAHRGRDTRLLAGWKATDGLPMPERERMMEAAGWSVHDIARAHQFTEAAHRAAD
jgi:hypothetical protein